MSINLANAPRRTTEHNQSHDVCCQTCGRQLTARESVQRRQGPICLRHSLTGAAA